MSRPRGEQAVTDEALQERKRCAEIAILESRDSADPAMWKLGDRIVHRIAAGEEKP